MTFLFTDIVVVVVSVVDAVIVVVVVVDIIIVDINDSTRLLVPRQVRSKERYTRSESSNQNYDRVAHFIKLLSRGSIFGTTTLFWESLRVLQEKVISYASSRTNIYSKIHDMFYFEMVPFEKSKL